MSLAPRLRKILFASAVGAFAGMLAWFLLQLFPSRTVFGPPASLKVALFVDISSDSTPGGTGLGGALNGVFNHELRPAPIAGQQIANAISALVPDLKLYTFANSASRADVIALPEFTGGPAKDGTFADATHLATSDLGKAFGPKLAIIVADRLNFGKIDIEAARALARDGWEVRVYGTVRCDAEALRNLASDIHFAFRERKAGLSQATKLAEYDFGKRSQTLLENFGKPPDLTPQGRFLVAAILGLLLCASYAAYQAWSNTRPISSALMIGFSVGILFATAAGFTAQHIPNHALWGGCIGLGLAIISGSLTTNARWFSLLIGTTECGVLLAMLKLGHGEWWLLALLGAGFGLAVSFSEEVSRRKFLEVRDRGKVRLINLGRREVSFGSSHKSSYVFASANPRVAAVRTGLDGPYRVDALTGRPRYFHPGEPQRIGSLEVLAHGRWNSPTGDTAEGRTGARALRIGEKSLPLERGATFSAADVPVAKASTQGIVAEVTDSPAQPGILGLTNRSGGYWFVTLPTGAQTSVAPGKTVKIAPGTRISFGAGDGVIESSG